MTEIRVFVPENDRIFFGARPIKSKHNLHETQYFGDAELIEILDNIPRSNLRIWTADHMVNDSSAYMYVDTTGIGGKDILECVKRGEFWINLQRVDKFFDQFKRISDQLYESLTAQCPQFQVSFIHSYILLSSPKMYFQLHVDSYENMFWCVRGGKDFYLYPPADPRVASREFMEDVCAGVLEDFLPHTEENRSLRMEVPILPGDLLSWPQHSPHEFVNNEQFNVGLGTFHGTKNGAKRILNYQASRYFRENLPLFRGNMNHDSLSMTVRRNLYRGMMKFGQLPVPKKIDFWTSYRLDPSQSNCMSKIENGPVLAEFSR
jgi:hypothetical protein